MAYQGHIVVPTTHEQADVIIRNLKAKMSVKYGGYSCYEGSGGWVGDDGRVEEDHVRLVVDTDEMDRASLMEYLRVEAEYVKETLDEDAVLVEVHEIDMEFV